MQFEKFQSAVDGQFRAMSSGDLFRADIGGGTLWGLYLESFPPGSNPVLRKRAEHDCSCCRHFIKTMGNVVSIENGEIVTIWDGAVDDPAYHAVSNALARAVRARPIKDVFLHYERVVGTAKNFEDDDGRVVTWNHFCVEIPLNNARGFICAKAEIPTKLGERRSSHDVLFRALEELKPDAVSTVLELMDQNNLYRGAEYRPAVEAFAALQSQFDRKLTGADDLFVWSKLSSAFVGVARIRNTAIGTLLADLSAGVDVEKAVKSYEVKTDARNFKRSSSLVTQAAVDAAKKAIDDLGLTSALDRRYAVIGDISVNNVIFADRTARALMRDALFDGVARKTRPINADNLESIDIESFIAGVVPRVSTIDVMFENRHAANLVSLIAPQHASSDRLFKWDNGFSWSYNGDVTDSIKEKVKRAGGSVTGDLCCRLAWYNFDDLDLHMVEPNGRGHIYYANARTLSRSGGMLDVDMNAGGGRTREPVENIFYKDRRTMKDGVYMLFVKQFAKRESDNVGFDVEIDICGETFSFAYPRPVQDMVEVAEFSVRGGEIEMRAILPEARAIRTTWGIATNQFHRVDALMFSPNYWGAQRGAGNKHYFFMLDQCKNDGQPRGFYNEFLRGELEMHRKVFEIVGGRAKVAPSDNQLSGLGFSSTMRNDVLVKVAGDITRTMKVTF